jgi:hypothetical protein
VPNQYRIYTNKRKEDMAQSKMAGTPAEMKNVKCSEFDLSKLYVDPYREPTYISADKKGSNFVSNLFPKYIYPTCIDNVGETYAFVTGQLKLDNGGIPKINPEKKRFKDKDCLYTWLYEDRNNPHSAQMFDMLRQIDSKLTEEINVNKNKNGFICKMDGTAKKPFKKLVYSPMVRLPPKMNNDDDDDDKEADPNAPPVEQKWRVKIKIPTDFTTKDEDHPTVKTEVYLKDDVSGKRKKEPEQVKFLDDIRKYYTWKSNVKYAITLSKFWIKNSEETKIGGKECAFTLSLTQMYILEQGSSIAKKLKDTVFDDDDVPNDAPVNDKKPIEKKVEDVDEHDEDDEEKEKHEKDDKEDEDNDDDDAENEDEDDEDEDEEEEEEEEDTKAKKGKGRKK